MVSIFSIYKFWRFRAVQEELTVACRCLHPRCVFCPFFVCRAAVPVLVLSINSAWSSSRNSFLIRFRYYWTLPRPRPRPLPRVNVVFLVSPCSPVICPFMVIFCSFCPIVVSSSIILSSNVFSVVCSPDRRESRAASLNSGCMSSQLTENRTDVTSSCILG